LETLKSKALAENLAVTKVSEIVLDDQAKWLLSLTEGNYGIKQRCRNFLEELYHPYTNPEVVATLIRQSILGDLWFYVQLPESKQALTVIGDLYLLAAKKCSKPLQEKRIIVEYLDYISALCRTEGIPKDVYSYLLDELNNWQNRSKELFIPINGTFRKCLSNLVQVYECNEICFVIMKDLLLEGLEFWQRTSDIEGWGEKTSSENGFDIDYLSANLGKKYYEKWLKELEDRKDFQSLQDIPSFTDIAILHRETICEFKTLTLRIKYIFYLLGLPGMEELRDHLLWDLNRQLADLETELNEDEVPVMLDSVFKTLYEFTDTHLSIVLDCILTIGKTVLSHKNKKHCQHLLPKIMELEFTPPGKIKIDKDWQIEVDKNHIKHLRMLLELIAIDPLMCKDLLAYLIISLSQKGVFISDTDLFQKDVSAFLNSDFKPILVQTKHLLKMFPVFFNEIGAEGEIRDISTSIDELGHRKDLLMHFLRKQIHTESNNTHLLLIQKILNYWTTLDYRELQDMIPEDVLQYVKNLDEMTREQSAAVNRFLKKHNLIPEELLSLSWQRVNKLFEGEPEDFSLKRLKLLCYSHFLLKDKYNLDPYDIVKFLSRYSWFDAHEQNRLANSFMRKDYDSSIRQLLSYIGKMNSVILDPHTTTAWENIYYKRHIAAGIPSMYGMYREPKLEAMGMIFRIENVVRRLFEHNVQQLNLNYITGKTLCRIIRILELYDYAMKQIMVTNDAYSSALDMLRSAQYLSNLSIDQYLDIFKLLKDSVVEIINEYYYRFYDPQLRNIGLGIAEKAKDKRKQGITETEIFAEEFYRNLLSNSFLVQGLDNFITRILESLSEMKHLFKPADIPKVMSYDPDKLFFHLNKKNSRIENQVLLGSKAYFLKRMHQYEFPVPPGFVITTDLYRHRNIINTHPDISNELDSLIMHNLNILEKNTGFVLGDPEKPLLLSVRSGAPMSLPGAMNTFLNIGLNDEVTYKLSRRPNYGWTAWDCYRRLIQSWGMAYGILRDEFDAIMIKYKKRYDVELKTQFSSAQMQEMVQDYKNVLFEHNLELEQNPFMQLYKAISNVLDSWNADRARLFRQKLHIADEWGTAVIIQQMILGNISLESGTGVLFTHYDFSKEGGICLNGDFTLCSQGEDVVAGLVHTLPISETQRLHSQTPVADSLENTFPAIYNELLRYAKQLIEDKNYPHQEMEFTFEGPSPDQLYILQTRNQVIQKAPDYKVFGSTKGDMKKLAYGIGIGKGTINGIVVFNQEDIKKYADKGEALILVRPDTVPDDMELLFECQGLLTSRGGVTSHAAVTATRLGLIGVVNCRDLVVSDLDFNCRIGDTYLKAGDKIALDAISGAIYLGHYPLVSVHCL
jgi:pyruvate,orthophosphate dikinase